LKFENQFIFWRIAFEVLNHALWREAQKDWSEGESQKGVGGDLQEDVEGDSEDAEMNAKMEEEGNGSGNERGNGDRKSGNEGGNGERIERGNGERNERGTESEWEAEKLGIKRKGGKGRTGSRAKMKWRKFRCGTATRYSFDFFNAICNVLKGRNDGLSGY
jgi:hypothetical protein